MSMAARAADDRVIRDTPQVSMPGFVGRDREVALLTQALVEPAVVLVEGEAGIGKSRLVQEFVTATPGCHRIAVGVCPPFRESPTLGPIVEAVHRSRETIAELGLSPLAGALRPLFPEWADDLPATPEPLADPPAARHRLFRALAELINGLGVTVLVVEDVHWADVATLEFILFLLCRQPQPVSLVVTYRPEDVPSGSLLLRLSSRMPATTSQIRLRLQPLDVAGAARLVSSMLGGQEVSAEFARFLHQHTDGVPLALEESVRLLRDRADLVRQNGGWARRKGVELQVPPTVRDAVLERVQRLSGSAHRVLQACAVLGEPLDESVVVAVAGLSDDQAHVGMTEAMGCGLLHEDPAARLSFRHVLPGRAVYEAIPAMERRRLHRRAGDALEGFEPTPVLQLTRHFREANESERWSRYAEQAAARAVESGDHGAAAVLLSDLLEGAELPLPTRVGLARKLAGATLFRRDAVDELHQRVVRMLRGLLDERLGPREEAELRSGLGRLLAQLGDLEGARAELERAVPNLDHDPAQAARAMAFLGIPFIGNRPAPVHLAWLRRAEEIDPRSLTAADRLALTIDRASGLLALGDESGWAVAAQIPTEAVRPDERLHVTRGHLNVGTSAMAWGHYAQARQRLVAALRLADADRYLRIRARILVALARLDWYTGAWRGLVERLGALVGTDRQDPVAYLSTMRLGLLNLAQGATRRGEEQVRLALDMAHRVGAVDDFMEPAAALGRIRLAEGKVEDALQVTDDPMRTVMSKDVWVWATDVAPVRVRAMVAAEEVDDAADLVARYRRGLGGRNAPAARAGLVTSQAFLTQGRGDPALAARAFAGAAQAWDQLPRPYEALLAREQQARCLMAAGETDSAVDLLTRLSHGLSDLGARGDFDRVAALLGELGVDAHRSWRRGRRGYGDQLSPRELEVVRLLVTGRTNREIADVLSRSPKTVAGQLSSAMRKLGVSSRTGLAVAAVDAGLVPDDRPERKR
jgi:DNA-binding CsgD family transcriptional regulator/tetratricopeptide (TPR) repeat protein